MKYLIILLIALTGCGGLESNSGLDVWIVDETGSGVFEHNESVSFTFRMGNHGPNDFSGDMGSGVTIFNGVDDPMTSTETVPNLFIPADEIKDIPYNLGVLPPGVYSISIFVVVPNDNNDFNNSFTYWATVNPPPTVSAPIGVN